MAERPIFIALDHAPYVRVFQASFTWAGGFALSQKRKNVNSMHEAFRAAFPGKRILEISSASETPCGTAASAFHLKMRVPSLSEPVAVENVFQSSKVFTGGGPYTDLLGVPPKDAKRDERLRGSGSLLRFSFAGTDYPTKPETAFYDYIYISALFENEALAETLAGYDAFTDVAFNPERSLNCQARSAALFTGLRRAGKLAVLPSFGDFLALLTEKPETAPAHKPAAAVSAKPAAETKLSPGDAVIHPAFGTGEVLSAEGGAVRIRFPGVGEKTLGRAWLAERCRVEKKNNA